DPGRGVAASSGAVARRADHRRDAARLRNRHLARRDGPGRLVARSAVEDFDRAAAHHSPAGRARTARGAGRRGVDDGAGGDGPLLRNRAQAVGRRGHQGRAQARISKRPAPMTAPAAPTPSSTSDSIAWVRISSCYLPLANPISDAKVLTGRQKPMTEIAMLFAEIETKDGHQGLGLSYSKRAGGPGQFAHAREIAPALIGEDPSDISKIWTKLCWAGASVGRSGMSTQAIGAFDV